jgi:hypothetical protein
MSTTSRIPAAVDALITALNTAIGVTTNVVDGPPLAWDNIQLPAGAVVEERFLFVGARPDDENPIEGDQDFNAAGAVSRDETFTIWCTAFVWGGDQVMKTRRDDAFGIVAAVEQAIRTDPSLAGAVLYSRMSGVQSAIGRQTEDGTDMTVVFAVACRAYLT